MTFRVFTWTYLPDAFKVAVARWLTPPGSFNGTIQVLKRSTS